MPLPLRSAWLAVALLWPVALLNYLDRQLLAAMKFSVMADVPDVGTDANWGYMLGQFKWVYAALSPVGGYLADRFSRRLTVAASLFAWSAVTWWTGRVESYADLLLARTLMGVSEAFYIPAALALIADYHTGATRSRAVGVHQTAIYCGLMLGGFGGYAADAPDLGWRTTFAAIGLAGIVYALPLVLLLKDAPGDAIDPPRRPGPVPALWELVSNPSFILLVLVFTLPAIAGWVVRDWMPAILKDRFALGQGMAGVSATLFVNAAAFGGAFLGGWAADRAAGRSPRGRVYVSATGIALLAPALMGIGTAGSLATAVAFLVLFGLGWGVFDGNNMPILSQIVRPDLRATGYGVMNLVSISAGGFADWWFGALRDARVPLDLIFGAFAGTAVVSVVLLLLVRPRRDGAGDATG
ncbi:MAG TPA: MFS transporter [Urbifossiella sp.]|jgi:MFS family permease|nr:MFS transporter [Urbifossiella sp.]